MREGEGDKVQVATSAVKALVDNAKRLGLKWQINFATTVEPHLSSGTEFTDTAIIDGDTASITVVSLVGLIPNGSRVAVLSVPDGANYIIGMLAANPLPNCISDAQTFQAGTTTSATYVDMAANPTAFTKRSAVSSLKIDLSLSFFVGTGSTRARFGISIDGTDYNVCEMFVTVANTIIPSSGSVVITGVSAGVKSIQLRWLRISGTGILNTTSAEAFTIAVCETN